MSQTISDALAPTLALAVSKADLGKNFREDVPVGATHGSALVRVTWDLQVGEDYEQAISHTIPWQALLGRALSKLNGVTIDALIREHLEADEDKAATKEMKAAAAAALATIKGATPKRQCKGKVTGEVIVTQVSAYVAE